MPSVSDRQRRFMGAVLGAKEGRNASPEAKRAARSMSTKQIKDFTRKSRRR